MPRLSGKIRQIYAEEFQRRRQLFLVGQFKKDARIGRNGQPGILGQLVLELPSPPSRLAEGNHHVARVPGLADRQKDIA